MRELRLHRELYRGEAVDAAAKVYAPYASIELIDDPTHWIVRVTSSTPAREVRVARELANHALGTSIRDRG
ncbi:MAG: HxsD-like protein [Deltaproteobacteria bacterium]|nr:HxsD-like protein [Deltaproteobacteria bacterium]